MNRSLFSRLDILGRGNSLPIALLLILAGLLRVHHLERWLPDFFEEATPVLKAGAFWGPTAGTFDFNPHFFNYPALSFYVHFAFQSIYLGLGFLIGRVDSLDGFRLLLSDDLPLFVLLGRSLTVLFDLGTVVALYFLGKRLSDRLGGLLAALFLAFNSLHIQLSQTVIVDIPLAFFTVVTFLFLIDVIEKGDTPAHIRTGLAIGLAAATKYTAALLFLPLLAAAVPHLLIRNQRSTAALRLLFAFAAAAAIFFLCNPYILLDSSTFWDHFSFERRHMAAGHFGHDTGDTSLQVYALQLWNGAGVVGIAAAISLIAAGRSRDWKRGVFFFWILFYLAVVASWSMRADRYLLPALPFILLAGALGLSALRTVSLPSLWRGILLTGVVLAYLLPQLLSLEDHYARIALGDTRVRTRQWIEAHVPPGTLAALESYTYDPRNPKDDPLLSLKIPMMVVDPEGVAPFYDLRWYENFDYILISSAIYQRYRDRADEFPEQIRFYQTLEQNWDIARRFAADADAGPTIVAYRNSRNVKLDAPLPDDLYLRLATADGSIGSYFLAQLAVNLGKAGFPVRAWDAAQRLARMEELVPQLHRRSGRAFHILGTTALERGDAQNALRSLRRAADLGSENPETYLMLGSLLQQIGRRHEAIELYHQLLTTPSPWATTPYYHRIGKKLNGLQDFDGAIRAYERTLILDEDDISARLQLGWNLSLQGRLADAITAYRQVLGQGENGLAQFNLGFVLLVKGNVQQAREAYAEGVRLFGADEGRRLGAVRNLEHLISLENRVEAARQILDAYWPEN
jgi:tetratricopeptide (TPR) repeat protein